MYGSNAGVAQLVERNLAKVEVESSRLFSRSRILKGKPGFPFLMQLPVGLQRTISNLWRGSKEVMQRPAKPFRRVRFPSSPPESKKIAHLRVGYFFAATAVVNRIAARSNASYSDSFASDARQPSFLPRRYMQLEGLRFSRKNQSARLFAVIT
jgi:hypothetical protein